MTDAAEKRIARLCGRASREAWIELQRLKTHPRFDELLAHLEAVDGTLHDTDIEQAVRRIVDEHEYSFGSIHALSPQIVQALHESLDAAIELQGANMGNIQIVDNTGALRIVAQRGLHRDFLEYFACVRLDGSSVCARSFRAASPVVIADVHTDATFAPHLAIAKSAGFRAVQTIPLVNSSGSVVGMLSVHFKSSLQAADWRMHSLHKSAVRASAVLNSIGARRTTPPGQESAYENL